MMPRTSRWTSSTSRSWTVSARSSSRSTRCPRTCRSGSGSRSRCATSRPRWPGWSAEEDPRLVAARGTEQSRTVTFDSASLTIMIRIEANKNGSVRVDGWLAPPQPRQIEMQTSAETLSTASDEQGRFAFGAVPHGHRATGRRRGGRSMTTERRTGTDGGDPGARPLTRCPGDLRLVRSVPLEPGVGGPSAGRAGGRGRPPGDRGPSPAERGCWPLAGRRAASQRRCLPEGHARRRPAADQPGPPGGGAGPHRLRACACSTWPSR